MNALVVNASSFGPFCNCHALAFAFNISTIALVSSLLCGSGPSAVFRAIRSIIIDSFNGVFFRGGFSHVSKEIKKISPPFAYINPARSVIFKIRSINVFATSMHKSPSVVFLGGLSTIGVTRMAMHKVCLTGSLQGKTTARLRMFVAQFIGGNDCSISANTYTSPMNPNAFRWRARNNSKSGEFLTGKVYEFWHSVTWKLNTVKRNWQTAVIQFFGSYPSQPLIIF